MTLRPWVITVLVPLACTVDIRDYAGRACDDAHPCVGDRVCSAGRCSSPHDVVEPTAPLDCGADAGPCTVGLGECQRTGRWACAEGAVVCSAAAGAAVDEVCDGKDNDCDGRVDVGRERLLAAASGGLNEHLSWAAVEGGGFAALYQATTRDGVTEVRLQRLDEQLRAMTGERVLAEGARAPSLVVHGQAAYVAWVAGAGSRRVVLSRLNPDTGAAVFSRTFPVPTSVEAARLVVANEGAHVLVTWLEAAVGLVAVTVSSEGTTLQGPQPLDLRTGGEEALSGFLAVAAAPVGDEEYQLAWVDESSGQKPKVRTTRLSHRLQQRGAGVLKLVDLADDVRVLQLSLASNVEARDDMNRAAALAWQEVGAQGESSVKGSRAPLSREPVETWLPPAPNARRSLSVLGVSGGALLVVSDHVAGTLTAVRPEAGLVVDLTPTAPTLRVHYPQSPASLARSKQAIALGFAVGGDLYGQLVCEP